jgi:hypothetical protein
MQMLCTTGEWKQPEENPPRLSIRFPLQRERNFVAIKESEKLQQQLKHYFTDALGQSVGFELIQEKGNDSEAVAQYEKKQLELQIDGHFQIELEQEALLRRIVDLFDAEYIGSTPIQPPPQTFEGEADEYSEDDERDAENAD